VCDPIHYWAGVVVWVSHYPIPLLRRTNYAMREATDLVSIGMAR
jgi:hypothetical protein